MPGVTVTVGNEVDSVTDAIVRTGLMRPDGTTLDGGFVLDPIPDPSTVIDRSHAPAEWSTSPNGGCATCATRLYVTIDLGTNYPLTGVTLYHYHGCVRLSIPITALMASDILIPPLYRSKQIWLCRIPNPPYTSHCKINGHFSIHNRRFSGAILRYLCIFSGKLKKQLAIRSTLHLRRSLSHGSSLQKRTRILCTEGCDLDDWALRRRGSCRV